MQRPENDIRENLRDLRLGNDFLVTTVKAQAKKEKKTNKLDFVQIKNILHFLQETGATALFKSLLSHWHCLQNAPPPEKKNQKEKTALMLSASCLLLASATSSVLRGAVSRTF